MASQDNPKTVELYGFGPQHEATALGTITPGMLVERAPGGVQAHGTDGGPATAQFANEYGMTGRTIRDDYIADDNVIFTSYVDGSGDGSGIYAVVAAGAAAIAESDLLASAGDGTLKVAGDAEVAVARALDELDNSGASETARLRVETISAQRTAAAAT